MSTDLLRSPWPLRVLWLLLPVLVGPAVADAFADRSRAVQVTGAVLAWGLWLVGVGALAVLRSTTLTLARFVVPGALPLAVWCALAGAAGSAAVVAVVSALLALLLLAGPGVSDAFVDGSSYGSERRVALRVPPTLLVVAVPLTWALAAALVVAGPMLLAAEQWVAGGVACALGVAAVPIVFRRLHLLSRRWLVFVPAGLVVADPLHLHDPILFPRHLLARVGPALDEAADAPDVVDVTGGALGLALEVRSHEPVTVPMREGRGGKLEREGVHALLVTPTQPASTIELARESKLPVG